MTTEKAIQSASRYSSLDSAMNAAGRRSKLTRVHHGEFPVCYITDSGRVSAALKAAGFERVAYR